MANANQCAHFWASNAHFDPATQQEVAKIMQRDQVAACFGSELHFGTGGLRGILGVGTSRMNAYTVARATLGLAHSLKAKSATRGVVIAYDSRHQSAEFAAVTAGVLASEGIPVWVFPTLVPTPMLSYAVRMLKVDAGVMITASHNPANYNGYKVYGADGCQITDHAADEITIAIEACSYIDAKPMTEEDARACGLWHTVENSLQRSFAQACLRCRVDAATSARIRVVYTPLHGTGLKPVREVLGQMQGVELVEVSAQCNPDGDFPTCPKPNPEFDETLALGIRLCQETNADLLLATDPDCDRVGVAVRTANGSYVRLSGNEVGLLLLDFILSTRKEQGALPQQAVCVKTVVTSDLAFSIAKTYNVSVHEVLTGFKYIGETIGKLEKESNFVFGFEESCGYLAGTHVRDKDGVMACMLVCEMAQALKAKGITLYRALQALYARYGYLATRLVSLDIAGALPMQEMAEVMRSLRTNPPANLATYPLTVMRDYLSGIDGLPKSDVLVFEADKLKAIVRPSGTEPKLKIYLSARAQNSSKAAVLLDALEKELRNMIHNPS